MLLGFGLGRRPGGIVRRLHSTSIGSLLHGLTCFPGYVVLRNNQHQMALWLMLYLIVRHWDVELVLTGGGGRIGATMVGGEVCRGLLFYSVYFPLLD